LKIIGFDAATKKTGWAYKKDNQLIDYGLFKATDKEINVDTRIEELYKEIKNKILEIKPDYIVFEDTHGVNKQIARGLSRLHGCILSIAFNQNLGVREYMPSQWRSAVNLYDKSKDSKKRDYQKMKAIEYVNKKYGTEFIYDKSDKNGHDDQAEAICIVEAFEILK
jgi:Holliday junction resolvasome RuvABC endonuclease subunit